MKLSIGFALLLIAPKLYAEAIDGFWQHEEEPVWIEISAGGGQVVRNDNRPEAVGFEMLRDLRPTEGDDSEWSGEVYAARLGEYKDATLTLEGDDLLRFKVKVGFMSRTVLWRRVASLPAE